MKEIPEIQGIEGPSKAFLERLNKSMKSAPMITNWDLYRKRHNLNKKTRIFICKEYRSFKKALIERGWHENTDN
jgi:hypothetical protein